jgi:hypothetical protein
MSDYGVSAKAYLARCAERLREDRAESLFYAAFELRNCVEVRQAEYLYHYAPYKNTKIRPYRIGETAKRLNAIKNGDLIGKFEFHFPNQEVFTGYHTPVPKRLRDACERQLDGLRHAQHEYRALCHPWWAQQRDLLITSYRLAWVACQGDVPMPPLWNTKTGEAHPMVFDVTPENEQYLNLFSGSVGANFSLRVSYIEVPPASWVPDL